MALVGANKQQRTITRAIKEIETQANRGNLLLFSAQLKIIETWLRELEDRCDAVVEAREGKDDNEEVQPAPAEEPVPTAEVAPVQQPNKKRKRNTKKSTSGPGKA